MKTSVLSIQDFANPGKGYKKKPVEKQAFL